MTWLDFQKEAYNLTQDEINVLSRQVMQQYKLAYEDIAQKLESQYAKLLTGVKPEDYYNEMIKFNRLEKLLNEVKQSYTEYSKQAGLLIENISFIGLSNTYYRMEYASSWLADFTVGIIPKALVEFTVYGTKDSWNKITKRIEDIYGNAANYKAKSGTLLQILTQDRQKELVKIQNSITQGLLQGKSYIQTTADLKDIIGQLLRKDGKYTAKGAMYNAMRIIRTESNRTMNAAAYANAKYLESQGIDVKKQLVSVLDNRTRSQSARMDGQTKPIDEPFKYPNGATSMYPGNSGVPAYDINDRETMVEIIGDEEPGLRRGRNPITGENETFNYKNFEAWAKENGLKKNKYGELLFPE